ncbi:g10572 [Coccomyxa viridis]|uniref:G10572 protein n=1 Tax=Coccomyxa viridis TaxID=1274662 RepID=A0ABP1G9X9_9CHLO
MSKVWGSQTSARSPTQIAWKKIDVHRVLRQIVDAHEDEAVPLLKGFLSLFCVLASYFVVLPIRDEAGVALGTEVLPVLFCLSLLVTLIATPLAAEFLLRSDVPRERALRQLFTLFAGSFVVFFVAYAVFTHAPAGSDLAAREGSWTSSKELGKGAGSHPVGRRGVADTQAGRTLLSEGSNHEHATSQALTHAQVLVRAAFFLWLTVVNLVALSAVWARLADVFGSGASKRLFGFLGAGATCGQLAGSLMAAMFARMLKAGALHALPVAGMQACPMLLSALLLEGAGQAIATLKPVHASPESKMPSSRRQKGCRPQKARARLWRGVARLLDGFSTIRGSRYLTWLTVYIMLNTTISSLVYFEKSMVVASAASDSASRMAIFATINSASALVIAGLQLFATGFLLTRLKLPAALAASAAVAAVVMAVIAVHPSPVVVGGGEVIRKVVNYVLTKPAREALFTVVSPEERYKGKLCMDTVIVRLGDTVAAGLFQVLAGFLHVGPSGVALAAFPVCLACASVAYFLGLHHELLAAKQLRQGVS